MKKLLITLAACLMLAGCGGVSQSDYDAAIQERDTLATQVAELQTANAALTDENNSLKIAQQEPQTVTDTAAESDYAYIGNANSLKFHLPTCEYLPAEYNRVYYQTREDAINDGMVACKVCCP